MKNKKKKLCVVLCCVLAVILGLVLANVLWQSGSAFNGSRVRGETQYMLDILEMNGEQTHTLSLAQGDELYCSWAIERGTVDVMICGADGEKLYQGNRIDQAEFILPIEKTGEYTIFVTAEKAKGQIDIHKAQKEAT